MALPVLLRRLFFISLILCVVVPVSWLLLWNNSVDNKLDINTYAKHHLPQAATTSSTTAKSSVVERSVKKYRPTRPGVLVLYKYKSSINFHLIKTLLQSLRIDFDSFVMSKAALIPKLVHSSSSANAVGIYRFIIIVNAGEFYQDSSISTLFNEYCQQFDAVMILMASLDAKEMHFNQSKLHDYYDKDVSVFSLPSSLCSYDLKLNGANDFVYTADGGYWNVSNVANKTKAFWLYENKFKGTMFGSIPVKPDEMTKRFQVFASVLYCDKTHQRHSLPVVMIDQKAYGNIKKVYFGLPMSVALAKLLFMEILNAFSENSYRLLNLTTRWIQIDIDDIFVAPPGSKLKESDVEAMINAQKQFQSIMNGFQFNLGFCGSYYQKGLMSEKIADKLLVSNAQLFKWFGHTYEHSKPHTMSLSSLYLSFKQNKLFAKKHNLPINPHYAVSPHHSGVYPIHESLYTAWADIWNITVTSTEEYPHLRPDHMRRGFIHNDIMVLPRQTCRLFTHTTNYSHFHGGREEVISFSEGGEVFNTVLYNPVIIFMTHTGNYGGDRLSLKLFSALFKFIQKWTKLKLKTDTSLNLAKIYFHLFPNNSQLLLTSPCEDKRHLAIWANSNCSQLPSFVLVGPQKSGSTALQFFLKHHPQLLPNNPTAYAFEEIQFFSNNLLYNKGVNWYLSRFPVIHKNSSLITFEKSATYFTHSLAPKRMFALMPGVKIIIILADPIKRAYSWYQHMRFHDDPTALSYNFTSVIRATKKNNASKKLLSLRSQCLLPGQYYQYTLNWLNYFSAKQIYFVDGNDLVENPVNVLTKLAKFLHIEVFPFSKLLRFNTRKGFYCVVKSDSKSLCLGKSKGRKYPPIINEDVKYLQHYYSVPNRKLYWLLLQLSKKTPSWLFNNNYKDYNNNN